MAFKTDCIICPIVDEFTSTRIGHNSLVLYVILSNKKVSQHSRKAKAMPPLPTLYRAAHKTKAYHTIIAQSNIRTPTTRRVGFDIQANRQSQHTATRNTRADTDYKIFRSIAQHPECSVRHLLKVNSPRYDGRSKGCRQAEGHGANTGRTQADDHHRFSAESICETSPTVAGNKIATGERCYQPTCVVTCMRSAQNGQECMLHHWCLLWS